jgi:hypothetical protein
LNILRQFFSKVPRSDCLPGDEIHAVKQTADEKGPKQQIKAAVIAQVSARREAWRIPRSCSLEFVEMGKRADCIESVGK